MDNEKIKKFWSDEKYLKKRKYANFKEYSNTYDSSSKEELIQIKKTIDKLDIKNKIILDLGGGDGYNLKFLFDENNEKHLLDISENKTKYAKDVLGINNVYCCDFLKNSDSINNKKFDVISILDVIEHIHPLEIEEFILKAKKHLKKNGIIIISTPNINSFQNKLRMILGMKLMFYVWDQSHITAFRKQDLDSLMKNNGFKKITLTSTKIMIPIHFSRTKYFILKLPFSVNQGEHLIGVWKNK